MRLFRIKVPRTAGTTVPTIMNVCGRLILLAVEVKQQPILLLIVVMVI